MINVVTHDGKFHPDEIYACVLLNYFTGEKLDITRTRNPDIIKEAQANKNTYVIDVGEVHDPSMNNLDHHQSTFTDVGSTGHVLSSCGLMWKKLCETIEITDFMREKIEEFTIKIDQHDNGVGYFAEVEFISLYNYNDVGTSVAATNARFAQNTRFKRAYTAARTHFKNMMAQWQEHQRKDELSKEALKHAFDGIIHSDDNLGINPRLNASDNLVVVCPRGKYEFTISSLNEGEEIDFSIRCPAPLSWRGKSGEELEQISGLKGMVFCHKSGFITVVKGDKNHAIEIAKVIVNEWKESK